MPTPFPGMDPYLEDPSVWEEFHHVFITECMYLLEERLPDGYVARISERVQHISISDAAAEQYIPDVSLVREGQRPSPVPARGPTDGGTAVAVAPVTIPALETLEVREGYIELVRMPDRELVTTIEVLSPWNKNGEGLGEYRHKRRALVGRGVHVVEIDLLRRGTRTELARPLPPGEYYVMVFHGDRRPDVDVYAWRLRDCLPTVLVPLKSPDANVPLTLAAVVTSAYDRGHFARKLRYGTDPPGPMPAEDLDWAREIAGTGRR